MSSARFSPSLSPFWHGTRHIVIYQSIFLTIFIGCDTPFFCQRQRHASFLHLHQIATRLSHFSSLLFVHVESQWRKKKETWPLQWVSLCQVVHSLPERNEEKERENIRSLSFSSNLYSTNVSLCLSRQSSPVSLVLAKKKILFFFFSFSFVVD